MRRINIINIFWVNPDAFADIKAVNFAVAEHGISVATDVLRVLIQWDDDFSPRAITNPNWLEVDPQWESWASMMRRVKTEEGGSAAYLNEASLIQHGFILWTVLIQPHISSVRPDPSGWGGSVMRAQHAVKYGPIPSQHEQHKSSSQAAQSLRMSTA